MRVQSNADFPRYSPLGPHGRVFQYICVLCQVQIEKYVREDSFIRNIFLWIITYPSAGITANNPACNHDDTHGDGKSPYSWQIVLPLQFVSDYRSFELLRALISANQSRFYLAITAHPDQTYGSYAYPTA